MNRHLARYWMLYFTPIGWLIGWYLAEWTK